MAKKAKPVKPLKPASLTMQLFAPGMTSMHRAGLGGLACSLRSIEKRFANGEIDEGDLPGCTWENGRPPWTIEADQITLDFGEPTRAGEFLERLFRLSFMVLNKNGNEVIFLPGQYREEPSISVLADAQSAITLTFLQHGLTRTLAKNAVSLQIDAEGDGSKMIQVDFKSCSKYKHQEGWKAIIDKDSCIQSKPIEVSGPINPGAVIRHVAYTSSTKIEDPIDRVLPLYFAIVGCLALPINRGVGVLIVPEIDDLKKFSSLRPLMSPKNARDCKVAGASDAALQCQLRILGSKEMEISRVAACTAILFRSTPWASQQKSRVDAIEIPEGDYKSLRTFELAVKELAPRVIITLAPKDAAKAKKAKATKKKAKEPSLDVVEKAPEHFWSDSIVRPLVADNLARGQPWYRGFHDLMTKLDPVSKKPKRLKLSYEKVGLKNMIEKVEWNDQGEKAIVLAVHQAIRQRLGQIAGENKGKTGTMKNRMQGEFDKWRLAFSGAKTPDQFRKSLCDLFGRAGINPVLKEHWTAILPWLSSATKWQLARDLSLLALASYTGTGAKEIEAEEVIEPIAEAS